MERLDHDTSDRYSIIAEVDHKWVFDGVHGADMFMLEFLFGPRVSILYATSWLPYMKFFDT